MSAALVLGGGGVTGIAWQIGLLHGLRKGSERLRGAIDAPDLVVGTSAGSVVGTHIAAGTDLDSLFAAQQELAPAELASPIDVTTLAAAFASRLAGFTDTADARRRIGTLARETDASIADARRTAVAARLPVQSWPARRLVVTAVDVDSGETVLMDADGPVPLDDAIAASCAVPGVWPVVTTAGRTLMDGGVASLTHASLAAGHDLVVVLVPLPDQPSPATRPLADELAALRASGAEVLTFGPDPDYLAGPGRAVLDPAGRGESALAGHRFGLAAATRIASGPSPRG